MIIYFTIYHHGKSIKILSLYDHELMGKFEECEEKKNLMVDNYMLNKVLESIEEIIDIGKT